jgi:translation elongation factor EF-Ts
MLDKVNEVRTATGVGLYECAMAYEKCQSVPLAVEYLRLNFSGVARFKRSSDGGKVRFTDGDYLAEARSNLGTMC